jgi:hypothetical protein
MSRPLDLGPDGGEDRMVLRLDPGGPMELTGLTDSFAALARIYERHHRPADGPAPKLYVTRLETGSVIAEIVPLVMMMGTMIPVADSAMTVADFTRRVWKGIKAFSGDDGAAPPPPREDVSDLREFIKPLTGKRGASLGIKHARFVQRDGQRETVAEFSFDDGDLNRAAVNMDEALSIPESAETPTPPEQQRNVKEVLLYFEQASRAPGREYGRTADRAVVPDVFPDKPLPVYFRKSITDIKMRMVRSDENPLTNMFIVDVHVQYVNGEPKAYIVTDLHGVIPLDEE